MMSNLNDNILRRYYPIFVLWNCVFLHYVFPCQEIDVRKCPNTPENWQKASVAKNCSSKGCSEDEVYHCVPTQTKGQLVEVCTSAIFLQGVCPFFDTVGKRLQMSPVSCASDDPDQNCSTRYFSTSVYKYKVCFPSTEYSSPAYSWIHGMETKCRILCILVLCMFLHFHL